MTDTDTAPALYRTDPIWTRSEKCTPCARCGKPMLAGQLVQPRVDETGAIKATLGPSRHYDCDEPFTDWRLPRGIC